MNFPGWKSVLIAILLVLAVVLISMLIMEHAGCSITEHWNGTTHTIPAHTK